MMQNVAYAMGSGAGGAASGGSGMIGFLPIIIIFFIFYVLLIRPQQKKEQQRLKMIAEIKKGDRILTQGGIYGTVFEVKENKVILEVSERVKITLTKNAVSQRL
ncbi:MAG: preprotein translocase subunit YajC [Candidatus Ratteibacteria bacterium]|nr:preprotein translocase subunit YajC [Candidatus Ratteibacteria bacterium]